MAFDNAPIGMAIQDVDGTYVRVNRALCDLLGYSEEDLLTLKWHDVTHPDDVARGDAWLSEGIAGGSGTFTTEKRYIRRDGSVVWALLTVSIIAGRPGPPEFVFAQVHDITDRKRAEALQQHLAAIIESSDDTIVSATLEGSIMTWNPAAESLFGTPAPEMIGTALDSIVAPEHADAFRAKLEAIRAGRRVDNHETIGVRNDGKRLFVSMTISPVVDQDGRPAGVSVIARDLSRMSVRDPLTGLANRALFIDRIEHAIARKKRARADFAVLFIDLDDFKAINDSYGHAIGDELLRAVAGRIRSCLRAEDTAARLGGDEFAALVEVSKGEREAAGVAHRLVSALEEPFTLGGLELEIRASVGVARAGDGSPTSADLVHNADVAMYAAKRQGKNRYAVFHPTVHKPAGETGKVVPGRWPPRKGQR